MLEQPSLCQMCLVHCRKNSCMNIFLFKTGEVHLVKTISQYVSIGLNTVLELVSNKKYVI